jgi:hypothetical protein
MKFSEHKLLIEKVLREKVDLDWSQWRLQPQFGIIIFTDAPDDSIVIIVGKQVDMPLIAFKNTKTHEIKLFSAIGLGLVEPNE